MTTPQQYVPAEVRIQYYESYSLYTAGTKARVRTHGLIGIKNGEITPVEDPDSEPYLVISNQTSKNSNTKFYAVTEDNYFYLTTEGYWYHRRNQVKPEVKLDARKRRDKLTTLHQAVAKRVINDFLKDKLTIKSEDI